MGYLITTNEYEQRFQSIITDWLPPQNDKEGEKVLLLGGAQRIVRRDGHMWGGIVDADGNDITDSSFSTERTLIDENKGISLPTPKDPPGTETKPQEAIPVAEIEVEDRQKVRQAVAWDALSKKTKEAYQFGIKRLSDRGVEVDTLTEESLAMVISQLDTEGVSPSTLSLTVASVKWYFSNVLEDSRGWATTDKRLITIKRDSQNRGNGQVDGLDWTDVEVVCRFAEQEQSIKGYRDSALIRLMSDCLLRISEAVAVNVEDLQGNALVVQSSKTDQEGKGEALYVGQRTLEIIKIYCDKANITSGALFRRIVRGDHIQETRLTANGARRAIKAWADVAGIDGFISGHSLRVGSAVSLAQAGASVVELQGAGRWKSPQMPAHYARVEEAEKGAVARYRYKKG